MPELTRPKYILGAVFSGTSYNLPQMGWGIGNGDSIPWYSSEERIEFSKLVSPRYKIVGRHSADKFAGYDRVFALTSQLHRTVLDLPTYNGLFTAMTKAGGAPILVLGGERTLRKAIPWCDFIIVHEMKNVRHCDRWVKLDREKDGVWQNVMTKDFRDFVSARFVRSDFSHGSYRQDARTTLSYDYLKEMVQNL